MKNKELIQKLESLKEVKPDTAWKHESRVLLLNQISSTCSDKKMSVFVRIRDFFAQPSFAVIFVLALLIISSIFGVRAAHLRPGDSLYIAQIISEKTQLAFTFNEEKRTKLEMKFANDRAKLIAEMLAEASFKTEDEEKSNKLAEDFKKEIGIVKEKIQEMKLAESEEETAYVVGANLGKEDKGLEIYEKDMPDSTSSSSVENSEDLEDEENNADIQEPEEENASSTEATTEQYSNKLDYTHKKLEEAEELFNQQDYNGTLNKLEEVDALLSESGSGLATSTKE